MFILPSFSELLPSHVDFCEFLCVFLMLRKFLCWGEMMERSEERLDRFLIKFCCLRMFNIAADIHDAIG